MPSARISQQIGRHADADLSAGPTAHVEATLDAGPSAHVHTDMTGADR